MSGPHPPEPGSGWDKAARRREIMSGADWRERYLELRRRVIDEAGLGRPVPAVSPVVASLLAELLVELDEVTEELERLEASS